MFLKLTMKLIPGAYRNSSRLPFFYLNFLPRQTKILIISKASFYSSQFLPCYEDYYSTFVKSKPDCYPFTSYVEKLKNEIENCPSSCKLSSVLPPNFENIEDVKGHIQDIATKITSYDINELCKSIIFLNKHFLLSKSVNVKKLIKCLDEELWKRALATEEILNTMAVIKFSGFLKSFSYPRKGTIVLFRRVSKLSTEQVVSFFFLVKAQKWRDTDYKFSVISCILDKLSQFSLEELGIIANGMRKIQFGINKRTANSIFDKLYENIENTKDEPLQSICKTLQKMTIALDTENILNLQEKVIPYCSNYDVLTLFELMTLGKDYVCIHPCFLEAAILKIRENINNLSIYSLIRLVDLIAIYNIQDEELLMMAVRQFEKLIDVQRHGTDLACFCFKLTNCRIYSKALLDELFSEQFVKDNVFSSKNRNAVVPYWWIVFCHLEIEKPEYLNYKLEIKERIKLLNIYRNSVESFRFHGEYNSLKAHIIISFINLYGENAVGKSYCLPHYEKGLVLRFNKDFVAQPIPEDFFDKSKLSFVPKPLDTDHYWVFFNLLLRYSCTDDKVSESGFGYYQNQCRQLKAFGYIPILVPLKLYKEHKKNKTHMTFITDIIKKSLSEYVESGKQNNT